MMLAVAAVGLGQFDPFAFEMVDGADMDAVGTDDIHLFLDRAMVMLCHGHSPSRSGGGSLCIIRVETESAPQAETGRPKAALASQPARAALASDRCARSSRSEEHTSELQSLMRNSSAALI